MQETYSEKKIKINSTHFYQDTESRKSSSYSNLLLKHLKVNHRTNLEPNINYNIPIFVFELSVDLNIMFKYPSNISTDPLKVRTAQ